MLRLLLLAAVVAVPSLTLLAIERRPAPVASADPTYTQGTYSLRLTQEPCRVPEFREWLEEQGIPPALASVTTQAGRPSIAGCWAPDIDGDILHQDASTSPDQMPIARGWFK